MKRILLLFSFLIAQITFAQHCAFCGARISVLKPVAQGENIAISGLKITILDSLGKPIMKDVHRADIGWTTDTLRMWQNPTQTTFKGYIDNTNPMQPKKMRFWFAEDNYVLMQLLAGSFSISIEDPKGRFASKKVSIEGFKSYPLCSSFSNWDLPTEYRSFVADFSPLLVELKPLK